MPARRVRIGLDSSYLIALLSTWHEQHQRTLVSYQRLVAKGAQIVIPVHAILECFSVLTRIPAPYRSMPDTVKLALEQTFSRTAIIAGMDKEAAWNSISALSRLGLGGGQVYDAAIARSAANAGATLLFTWNAKHFSLTAPAGIEIREP